MKISNTMKDGARAILTEGLRLRKHDRVFILSQNELLDISDVIKTQCETLGIISEIRSFSKSDFYNEKYPKHIDNELFNSDSLSAIILLIEWSPETTGGRLLFLRKLMNSNRLWRIASMPGIQLKYLHYCQGDYKKLELLCEDVFGSLSAFTHATITTFGPNNEIGTLNLDLGKHKPITSSGIIENGKWGNVPSGETFCMPEPSHCNGTVYLRGSIPNYPLLENEWIFFQVEKGEINAKTIDASTLEIRNKFRLLFFTNGHVKHLNSNVLAELGVGLNEQIDTLTGMPLFDEKMIGTIHLGFGSNYQFNGPIKCKTHHDLVFTQVSCKLHNSQGTLFENITTNGFFLTDRKIETTTAFENFCNEVKLADASSIEIENGNVYIYYQTYRKLRVKVDLGSSELYPIVTQLLLGQIKSVSSSILPDFFKSKLYYQLLLYKIIKCVNK